MGGTARRQRISGSKALPDFARRRHWLLSMIALTALLLVGKAVQQQVVDKDFLLRQGQQRHERELDIAARRGLILDTQGSPLAVSAPVDSIWVEAKLLGQSETDFRVLAKALHMPLKAIESRIEQFRDKSFVYLKRGLSPEEAEGVLAQAREAGLAGVNRQREYRRYYPAGEVAAQLVGFTNIDDQGQEGLELAYDEWLAPVIGSKKVIRDGRGKIIEDVESIRSPQDGQSLQLSVDLRLQYLAYRALKETIDAQRALAGSAVILDITTGEVLAMVNQPSFNPNGDKSAAGRGLKNRVLTDLFEPGSTIKPFVVAAALESGTVSPNTPIDTAPGHWRIGRQLVKDVHNYGKLDVSGVIVKSSNIGVSKIALMMPAERLWSFYRRLGFGEPTQSSFPGEAAGRLPHYREWSEFEHATLSFGYGMSVTALQLAQAYAVIANRGVRYPASLLKVRGEIKGEVLFAPRIADQLLAMMERVVSQEGTARRAMIDGYRVAGKTGTVKKITAGGYSDEHYLALFAGVAPVSDPRFAMVVMVDEPKAGQYYGGQIAAPVFARVVAAALRLMNVPPDAANGDPQRNGWLAVRQDD